MKKLLEKVLFVLILFSSISCSNDDSDQQVCLENTANLKINGENQAFNVEGYGINSRENGHVLMLNLARRTNNPYIEQFINIRLPFKMTGNNIIEQFAYRQKSIDSVLFNGNYVNDEFESRVITNTDNCFYATFSGKISDGIQEIIITDGIISQEYGTPFDE